jgi:ribosomal protein S18 acetylase RimI-like enzyme
MSRAPMADDGEAFRYPEVPEVERAYRAAFRALEPLISDRRSYVPEEGAHIDEVFSQFPWLVREAGMTVASHLGPRISWESDYVDTFGLVMAGADLDAAEHDFGPSLPCVSEASPGDWQESPLDQASRAYRRETRWDFAPGEAGVWLLMLAPTSGSGGDKADPWFYSGHLAGVVILYDRDKDGTYESVGHIWTGEAWRRQGIAARLLAEARSRFGADRLEGPLTDDGARLARAAWPELTNHAEPEEDDSGSRNVA